MYLISLHLSYSQDIGKRFSLKKYYEFVYRRIGRIENDQFIYAPFLTEYMHFFLPLILCVGHFHMIYK
jgi:hypothetical protein